MNKPGVLFYFELRPCLRRLTPAEKGTLFEAILDYGEFGVVPELEGSLGVAWDFIRPRIDRDDERYAKRVRQCTEAANRRWNKQEDANASESMPTTTTTTNSISTSNSNSISTATPKRRPTPQQAELDFEDRRRQAIARLNAAVAQDTN